MRAFDLSLQQQDSGQPESATQGRYLVFDTETTGLGADHRVIEIGAVEIINRRPTGREFHAYINPERSIDAEAERVHGLSARFLADKPKFREIAQDFISFLGKDSKFVAQSATKLVAHNATFDINKLNAELQRLGIPFRIEQEFEIIDTMKLSRKMYPGQRATMDALCDRLQVSRSERQVSGLHGALADSRILTRVFLAMTAGQVHFGYSEGRQAVAATGAKLDRSKYGSLKVIYATPDEEGAQARLCDSIEKSSGGYCGFRGKWTKPEKETAMMEAPAPAPEFGSGTAAPAPAQATTKHAFAHLVVTTTIAQPAAAAPTSGPAPAAPSKPAPSALEPAAGSPDVEFSPAI